MAKKKWSPKDYTQFYLFDEPIHTEAEIRAEYSRIRSNLAKRAKNLEKYEYRERANYLLASMPPLSMVESLDEIKQRLVEGKTLSDTKAYSIAGMKQLQIRYEEETGERIPLGEILDFEDYMKSWRLSAFSHMILDSDRARELYNDDYQEIGGNFADFYTAYQQEKYGHSPLPSELLRRNR